MKNNKKTSDLALISIGAAVMSLLSLITVPSPIPFTLQSFGVAILLLTFGGKRGTASVLIYLALGVIGLPVFSGFGSGIGVLLGPTGGFLLGFVAMGAVYWFSEKSFENTSHVKIVALGLGTALNYVFGTTVYILWSNANDAPVAFLTAVMTCVVPYAIPDVLKLILAYQLYKSSLSKIKI